MTPPSSGGTLAAGSALYTGWTSIRVTRGLKRCAADFDVSVSERWQNGTTQPWQILPFQPCKFSIGTQPALAGYVDAYLPSYGPDHHTVRVTGRSKTADLVDCCPEIQGGEFNGYTLDTIARAVCQPFGIDVVVAADMGAPFDGSDGSGRGAVLQKCETAFAFLERLARLRSVLLTDDPTGALVLTTAGATQASGSLVEGVNIVRAAATLSGARRFSKYTVRSQLSMDGDTQPEIIGTASDPFVPRYRPHASLAEHALDQAGAQERAQWEARLGAGEGTSATITVEGWYQPDGTLWTVNQQVPVTAPRLHLDDMLTVAEVTWEINQEGKQTHMVLQPLDALTPDPGQVRLRKAKGAGNASSWAGLQGITSP